MTRQHADPRNTGQINSWERNLERKAMIIKSHPLPVKRQAELLEISRSNVYYLSAATSEKDLALMRAIDELHMEGKQFTSDTFTTMLHGHGLAISMDGRGCWRDNVFVERLWRSIKYEDTCALMRASVRPKPTSDDSSSSTTVGARIPRSPTERRTRHTSPNKP